MSLDLQFEMMIKMICTIDLRREVQDCVNHDANLYRRLVITNLSLQWQPNQVDLVGIEEESYQVSFDL